jgi:hypothetical protein
MAGAAALAGCSEAGDSAADASANIANAAAAKPKKVPYCFFKDENGKDWTASVGKDGNVTVKGKGYVADARYKAALGTAEIDGGTASVQLKMPQNDTGFASADGWWSIDQTIPGSSAVTKVDVLCGERTEASLEVKR